MKSAILLLAVVSATTLASESIEIVPSQQNFYQDLLSMSPGERERLGINLHREGAQGIPFDTMPMPMNGGGNPWMMGGGFPMMGGYPGMNMNMMYPGYNQINRMNSGCGCQQVCPPCYLPWLCMPCQCPCQTTATPPDDETVTPPTDTTTSSTTTTTTPSTTTTQEVSTCIPCSNPCNPCGPVWVPWIPCHNVCTCNNGCQTVTPAPVIASTTVASVAPRGNNCQCECAPCNPLDRCPPCPRTCPC